jgi:hypothetical protein
MTTTPSRSRSGAARPIVWARRRRPVAVQEVTEQMLAPVRAAADASMLAQTVWPSIYYGTDFVGEDCLLISAAAVLGMAPLHAVPDADPLLTVLPYRYYGGYGRGAR